MPNRHPNPAAPVVSPLDLAITAALAGEREQALRHVGAILEEDPGRSVAVLLAGKLLGEVSRIESAKRALLTAVDLALLEGSLPRAVAAVIELRRLGVESNGIIQRIAKKFARGSAELMAQGAIPPALPRQRLSGVPLPHTLSGDDLSAHVEELVLASEEHAKAAAGRPHHVPRQVLLSALAESGLSATLEVLDLVWVDAATVVVEQGRPGEEAYIVARGELDVVRVGDDQEETPLARLGNGALFGEMALLSRAPRAARVTATRPSLLLVASSEALSTVVEREPDVGAVLADYCRRRMIDNLVRTSRILGSVSASERPELIKRFVTRSYETGDKLVTQGADAQGLHLIASGEVAVVHQTGSERTVVANLAAGEVVGEISLVLRRPASADVVATVPTVSLHLPQAEFLGVVKRYPELLAHLYELAVERDDLTRSIVAQQASEADDLVLL
jgi:CRP-like cAMP-binding protein